MRMASDKKPYFVTLSVIYTRTIKREHIQNIRIFVLFTATRYRIELHDERKNEYLTMSLSSRGRGRNIIPLI
jgi:hypothetical protein